MSEVDPDEELTRFLVERKKFSIQNRRVKYNAFMPAGNGGVSVFRSRNLTNAETWDIGEQHVATPLGKPLLGRAILSASVPLHLGLVLEPHEPPPHHANILGWPQDRSAVRLNAIRLAEGSRLELNPARA